RGSARRSFRGVDARLVRFLGLDVAYDQEEAYTGKRTSKKERSTEESAVQEESAAKTPKGGGRSPKRMGSLGSTYARAATAAGFIPTEIGEGRKWQLNFLPRSGSLL